MKVRNNKHHYFLFFTALTALDILGIDNDKEFDCSSSPRASECFHPHFILNQDSNDKSDHYISALERDLRQLCMVMNSAV